MMKMVSVARKLSRQKSGTKTEVVCFEEEITETKAITPVNCPPGFES
jgi:hypothetical protein